MPACRSMPRPQPSRGQMPVYRQAGETSMAFACTFPFGTLMEILTSRSEKRTCDPRQGWRDRAGNEGGQEARRPGDTPVGPAAPRPACRPAGAHPGLPARRPGSAAARMFSAGADVFGRHPALHRAVGGMKAMPGRHPKQDSGRRLRLRNRQGDPQPAALPGKQERAHFRSEMPTSTKAPRQELFSET